MKWIVNRDLHSIKTVLNISINALSILQRNEDAIAHTHTQTHTHTHTHQHKHTHNSAINDILLNFFCPKTMGGKKTDVTRQL